MIPQLIAIVFGTIVGASTVGVYVTNIPTPTPFSSPKPTAEAATTTPTPTLSPTPTPTHKPTPTPTITRTPKPIIAPANLEPLFNEFATKYRVDAQLLKKIANCESHFNPGVVSKNGLYKGIFQFDEQTWTSNRQAMGQDPSTSLMFGARESIETAAFLMSRRGPSPWPACSR